MARISSCGGRLPVKNGVGMLYGTIVSRFPLPIVVMGGADRGDVRAILECGATGIGIQPEKYEFSRMASEIADLRRVVDRLSRVRFIGLKIYSLFWGVFTHRHCLRPFFFVFLLLTEHDCRVTPVDENVTREVVFPLWHSGTLALLFQIKGSTFRSAGNGTSARRADGEKKNWGEMCPGIATSFPFRRLTNIRISGRCRGVEMNIVSVRT